MKYTFAIYYLKNKKKYNLFAFLIRLANKRPYNHIEVVAIPDSFGLPARFYGAVYPESRLASTEYIQSKYQVVKVQPLKNMKGFSDEENLKWLDRECGKEYSKSQILLQLFSACSAVLKRLLSKVQLNHEQKLICVELGARFMIERMGYVIDKTPDACQFKDLEDAKEQQ